jgi:hypothetical protein
VRIGPDAAARLEGASALIAGGVGPDGAPVATRAWGAAVQEEGAALRVYLEADDTAAMEVLVPGALIAVTGADVKRLSSAQAKGRVRVVEELTALDVAIRERSTELFVQAVHETDGSPRMLIESMVPERFVALTLDVDEVYDQTPGPQAGSSMPAGPA